MNWKKYVRKQGAHELKQRAKEISKWLAENKKIRNAQHAKGEQKPISTAGAEENKKTKMGQLQLRKSKRDESACVHKYGKDAEKRSAGPDDEGDFDEFMRSIRRAGSWQMGTEC